MDAQENFAPYAPTENVLRVLGKVRSSGLRGAVNSEFLIQLGINDSMAPRTIRALEFLGFVAVDGSATPKLEQYVVAGDGEAQALLLQAVVDSYAMIFRAVDPVQDPRAKVFNAFRTMKPQGQWDRMTTLFLGLCRAAGMDVKDAPPNRAARSEGSRDRPQRTVQSRGRRPDPRPQVGEANVQPHSPNGATRQPLDPALQSFVEKVRDLETLADLEEWYGAFRTVFQYVKKLA
jgi:hypothetical protein